MISYTEAKKKYKLTEEEIDSADLFYVQFKIHGNIGTRYLTSQIETLANKLNKDCTPDDKKRQAYLKQKEIQDEINVKKNKLEERTRDVKNEILELLKKYEIVINSEIDCYINLLIIKTDVMDIDFITILKMVDSCHRLYIKNKMKYERTIEMNESIEKLFNKKYHSIACNHRVYHNYVGGKINTHKEAIDMIQKYIQNLIDKENRENEITEEIKNLKLNKTICQSFCEYHDYINGTIKSITKAVNEIQDKYDKFHRMEKIDSKLRKEDLIQYQGCDLYNEYVDELLSLKKVIGKLKLREERSKTILDIFKMKAYELKNISKVYDQYICNQIKLDDAVTKIKEDIENHKINKINRQPDRIGQMPENTIDQRRSKMNCFINKCIGKGKRKIMWKCHDYKNYVETKKISFNEAKKRLLYYNDSL